MKTVQSRYKNPDRFIAKLKAELTERTRTSHYYYGEWVCSIKTDNIELSNWGGMKANATVGSTIIMEGTLVARKEYYKDLRVAFDYEISVHDLRVRP
jgi:hypothetical protein